MIDTVCTGKGLAPMVAGRYAAIDIGTVTCRLLVADVASNGAAREVLRSAAICNLGEGVDDSRLLDFQAMQRVVDAIGNFMEQVHALEQEGPAISVQAVATSACRDALNSEDLVAALASIGVPLAIIPGATEAALSFAGASGSFPGQPVMVVDVGGGSTEVVLGPSGGTPVFGESFNVGCRRLLERFLHSDPPSQQELDSAQAWVMETLGPLQNFLESERNPFAASPHCGFNGLMVAVAGTATTCVSVSQAMEAYDPARVHGQTIDRATLDDLLQRLAAMPLDERQKVVGLEPRRASVILGGLVILQVIMTLTHSPSFIVSETDILHGLLCAQASSDPFRDGVNGSKG